MPGQGYQKVFYVCSIFMAHPAISRLHASSFFSRPSDPDVRFPHFGVIYSDKNVEKRDKREKKRKAAFSRPFGKLSLSLICPERRRGKKEENSLTYFFACFANFPLSLSLSRCLSSYIDNRQKREREKAG